MILKKLYPKNILKILFQEIYPKNLFQENQPCEHILYCTAILVKENLAVGLFCQNSHII
jgi:hypothetical protein